MDKFMYWNREYALDIGRSAKGLESWIYLCAENKVDEFDKLPILYNVATREISLNFDILPKDISNENEKEYNDIMKEISQNPAEFHRIIKRILINAVL